MASTTSNIAFGNAYSSVQANTVNGSVHIGPENTLDRLPRAEDAPFNSQAKQHEPTCLPDTRVALLDEIYSWANRQDERCIFWLSGLAGTGKSTIARTVARSYYNEQRLAASFFFSRGGGDVSHANKFVTSIAKQLAHNVPASRQHIIDAVAKRDDIANQSLRDQWYHLVLGPLSKLSDCDYPASLVLIVDALDECDSDNDIRIIVQLLAEARSLTRVRLRVLLTSRPEVPIRHGFGQIADSEHKDVVLHNISPSIVNHDIRLFLEYYLRITARECSQADDWPGEETIGRLVQSACGLFIWAATACRFIQEGGPFATERLRTVLKDSPSASSSSPNDSSSSEDSGTDERLEILPEQRLDSIYLTVLKTPTRRYRKQERKRWYTLIREILGAIVLLQSPLSASSLAQLLRVPIEDVHKTLYELHSIVNVQKDSNRPVRLHHPSFRDFLLNRKRCNDSFWVEESSTHEKLVSRCLELMSTPCGLRQDICKLSEPGVLRSEIDENRVTDSLSPALQYACYYWVDHIERSGRSVEDGDFTHHFLTKHFLHWLEAMSLLDETSLCVQLVKKLQALVMLSDSMVAKLLHDAVRFMLRFVPILVKAPLQIYLSALLFSPETSIVQKTFMVQASQTVKVLRGRDAEWDACRSVLEGHSREVSAVVFSPGGQLVASASWDSTVRVWEIATGHCRSVLEGHSQGVKAVVFSPDGQLIASASDDRTVRLWETMTGRCCSVLEGHLGWVNAVVFSLDGQLVASASWDRRVRIWETETGHCRSVLEGHSREVSAVVFSPDGQLVASASDDSTVRIWGTATGQCYSVLEGHLQGVSTVVFSPGGQLVASASRDSIVRVWETATGHCRSVLEGHSRWARAVVFSPDGQLIASASEDSTVRVWETATGYCRSVLEGHLQGVRAVMFSPDGQLIASASWDSTVRVWETATGNCRSVLEGHLQGVKAVMFSPDGQLVASASWDSTVRVWETTTGHYRSVLEGHSQGVKAVVFSPDGQLVASASDDSTVRVWETATGYCRSVLEGHLQGVSAVVFSPDGQLIASASWDSTVRVWETATSACCTMLEDQPSPIFHIAFSPDGRTLHTDKGDISLPLDLIAVTSALPAQELSHATIDGEWILRQRRRFIWLPPEYRNCATAVYKHRVCLGCYSGRVAFVSFQ